MKRLNMKPYAALLALVALLSACSGPAENSGSSNTSAPPQQANSNSAPEPQIAQGNPPAAAPSPAPPTVQQIPPPPPAPAAKPAAAGNANGANAAKASGAGNARAPRLVAPDKQIDFGKQPQDKNLVRAIVIKNGGRADLNIESVVPSWGCTTVDFPKVLRPGQAGNIKVKVETGKTPGVKVKSVTIKTNDPNDPSHIVRFAFDVKG